MKKILSVFLLASCLGAGVALSAMNAGGQTLTATVNARPPKPCDACPPNWNCHVDKKTGQMVCKCVNCDGW